MILHRCKWVWNAGLNLYKHRIQTSYKEPWRAVAIALDETVYWQGRQFFCGGVRSSSLQ